MDQLPRSNRIFVAEGSLVGRLSVGPLVYNVREHPLYTETPISYIKQGRLHECTCSCGQVKLIAERVLETGRVQSCGCLKLERSRMAEIRKQTSSLTAEARKQLTQEIKSEQKRLKYYLSQFAPDQERITQIREKIKLLMAQRLSTVNFKKNAQQRIYRKDRKLLEEVEKLISDNHESQEQSEPGKA